EHRTARKQVIKVQQRILSEAYRYHHLLIAPTEQDLFDGPTTQSSLTPYFDPPIPDDPTKATLFCNLSITYPERCSGDSIADFPFDKPILPLLDTLLPGSTPSDNPTQCDLILQPNPLLNTLQTSNITHPTVWDPKYEFLPSKLSLYAATRRRAIISVTGKMTLADVCAETERLSPDPVDQEDAYRHDGEYIEVMEGLISLYAFRKSSKAEKKFVIPVCKR
ncbi:40S ribosomal protein, partial [Ceratobasidium sp. 395]